MTAVYSFSRAECWLARYHGWLLVALWASVQALCWHYYRGPRLFGDGAGYLSYAKQLVSTHVFAGGYYLRYVGYATYLATLLALGFNLTGIALVQVGIAGLATRAFYRTAWRLSGQHWPTAALATAALLCWAEVQAFNAFILTESLFTSLLILSAWAVARARGAGGVALAGLLLLLTVFVRPNGFIALGAGALAGLVWLQRVGWPAHSRWLALLLLLAPLAWHRLNWLADTLGLMRHYTIGTVICNYAPACLTPATALRMPAPGHSVLAQLLWFITHNFWYFCQLAALRLAYFMGFPKPWHSALHIAWLAATLPALYWLAVRGVARRTAALPVRTYLAGCLLLQIAIVLVTFEDWDVRFSGPMIPYWLLLAALGAQPGLQRLARRWALPVNEPAIPLRN